MINNKFLNFSVPIWHTTAHYTGLEPGQISLGTNAQKKAFCHHRENNLASCSWIWKQTHLVSVTVLPTISGSGWTGCQLVGLSLWSWKWELTCLVNMLVTISGIGEAG